MKRIYALETWCIDCKRCEVACQTFHSHSKDPVKAFLFEKNGDTRIRVEGSLDHSIAINCRHCPSPACVDACISGAMQRNPQTGVVTTDPEKCVGCRSCVVVCPFGAVHVHPVLNKAIKCDLCGTVQGEPGTPSCVAACPNNALIYVESEGL